MAVQTYKNLGQAFPATTAVSDIYTVPASTMAVISSIAICNNSTTTTTSISMSHAVSGVADTTKQYFVKNAPVEPKETKILTFGGALAATDVIRATVSTVSNLSINIWGVELT